MNNPFLMEFLKRQGKEQEVKKSSVTTTPIVQKRHTVRTFAESKPTAKQVETFFRERIVKLNEKMEEEEESD
jgi:hypothetical protein